MNMKEIYRTNNLNTFDSDPGDGNRLYMIRAGLKGGYEDKDKIDPVTKLEMQESRKKRRGFVEMYSELISKMDDADLEEFSVGAGLGGCVEKSRTFYAEAYNLASDIKFYYPYKQSDSVKKIMDTAWSKLDSE